MKNSVLVTGAAGFIGKNVVKELISQNYKVIATDLSGRDLEYAKRLGAEVEHGDLLNRQFAEKLVYRSNFIVHAAVYLSKKNKKDDLEKNKLITENLCYAATEKEIELFVLISSTDCYGDLNQIPAKETHEFYPNTHYGKIKAFSEKVAWKYQKQKGLPLVVLRPAMTYGDESRFFTGITMFFPILLKALGVKRFFGVKGGEDLQFVHVKDLAASVSFLINDKSTYGGAFNVAEETTITQGEFTNKLFDEANIKIEGHVYFPFFILKIWGVVMYYLIFPFVYPLNMLMNFLASQNFGVETIKLKFPLVFNREYFKHYFYGAKVFDNTILIKKGFEYKQSIKETKFLSEEE